MNGRDALGAAGSLLLVVGIFMPMVRMPVMGEMSYFEIAPEAGTVLIVLAAISLVLVNLRRYRFLWLTGVASLAVTAFSLLRSSAGSKGGLAQSLTDMASRSARLEWGLAVMAIGALLMLAAAVGTGNRKR